MESPFEAGPHRFDVVNTEREPSPLLEGNVIHVSLAPSVPTMQCVGAYVFSLGSEGELEETGIRIGLMCPVTN